ncbi:SDR family NAD(P)-dependent oxidoreductase [Novosphingobium colocasiae]|uniref:Oxidoreductase n=1 Tax=Novosphingobium colocasiae TaxID=1256513 RepID=A0A918PP45_9SPHN|nr:SDR family oxidoreductase [Novosphingobium colocasiae]GGZ17563.1 oxidoreductase [Novosphingobium colocasiae]
MGDFEGSRVLVTGGTQGIGRAIAEAFCRNGAYVVVTGTRAQSSDYDIDLSAFHYFQLDMRDRAQRAEIAEKVGALDVLINNAGGDQPNEFDLDNFEASIEVNLTAVMHLCTLFRPVLAQASGSILNIGSVASFLALAHVPGYTAGKSGVLGLTRALADRWAPEGIRVNMLAPGLIDTRATNFMRVDAGHEKRLLGSVPMRRWGQPDEIAGAALFLSSPSASYITGAALPIDGGLMIR